MRTDLHTGHLTHTPHAADNDDEGALLDGMRAAVRAAGARLLGVFDPAARPASRDALLARIERNEALAAPALREDLARLRPDARFVSEELEQSALGAGAWWAIDAVEGNVNHAHGLPEWGVTATLLRDDVPVAAVVHLPVVDVTFTAARGRGATRDGVALRVSEKRGLDAAIVATGQVGGDSAASRARMASSIGAMLEHALLVRSVVPSTFPLLDVASGQSELFWQDAPRLQGVASGVLLALEAGGVVSCVDGTPWRPGSPDVVVTTSALHAEVLRVLSAVEARDVVAAERAR